MTAADQIAEINAQYAERVKLLERERDAKIAMVRSRCKHEFEDWDVGICVLEKCKLCNENR